MEPIIIIGAGVAAYTVAREFRKRDQHTSLIIVSEDDAANYPKPMLSNALTKNKSPDALILNDASVMAQRLNATILARHKVIQIDTDAQTITLQDEQKLSFSKLVLAVGAHPTPLPIEGDTDAILSVNNLTDYRLFRDKLASVQHIAIIGTGLIGCEFANDLLNAGFDVTLIGPGDYPLANLLPPEIGQELQQRLSDLGAKWCLSTTASTVHHSQNHAVLTLQNGDQLHADLILAAIGLRANLELARSSGLKVHRGIITDSYLRTSVTNIYAIGDCAEVDGRHLPFIQPIMIAAKALAQTLAGQPAAVHYPPMPVAVKTPVYPLVIQPPESQQPGGKWQLEPAESGLGYRALYFLPDGTLAGFALSGDCTTQKQHWLAMLCQ